MLASGSSKEGLRGGGPGSVETLFLQRKFSASFHSWVRIRMKALWSLRRTLAFPQIVIMKDTHQPLQNNLLTFPSSSLQYKST